MKSKRGMILGLIVLTLISLSFYFDKVVIRAVSAIRNSLLDKFFIWITLVSSEVIIFFVLTALFLWREHKRKWILPLWMSLGLSAVISFILKMIIQRQRPFQLGLVSLMSSLQEKSYMIWNFSFPSFQTMLAFSALPIISKQFPKTKWIWIGFALLVGFSRMYFGLHFLSDVLAGALIGYLIGMLFMYLEKENKFGERMYKKVFGR